MEFELKKATNINKETDEEAGAFMRRDDHDIAARDVLFAEIERHKIKTKGELIDFARRRGFLKTDADRRVVNDVIRKSRLPENTQADRIRKERLKSDREAVNKYAGYKMYNT